MLNDQSLIIIRQIFLQNFNEEDLLKFKLIIKRINSFIVNYIT